MTILDTSASTSDNDLNRLPIFIFDDQHHTWKKRGVYGDHAIYDNDDGREVFIYHANISGTSANTSAGTFHWY